MIRVENLTKRYGGVTAVDALSFEVQDGETFALIGPNGAGKTTTLKAILGLVRPDGGRIALGTAALPPSDPAARRQFGYVPQRAEFAPERTVRDVLVFFARLRGLDAAAVERAIVRVGLEKFATRAAGGLSGGYVQRLALAQALLGDPAVLVLDEPTASLDPQAAFEFRHLVQQLQSEGKTIVLCSHLLAEVERIADRALILVGGRAAAIERLDDLKTRQVSATRLVLQFADGAADLAASVLSSRGIAATRVNAHAVSLDASGDGYVDALDALRHADVAVRSFEVARPTLEELFLRVVQEEEGHA